LFFLFSLRLGASAVKNRGEKNFRAEEEKSLTHNFAVRTFVS